MSLLAPDMRSWVYRYRVTGLDPVLSATRVWQQTAASPPKHTDTVHHSRPGGLVKVRSETDTSSRHGSGKSTPEKREIIRVKVTFDGAEPVLSSLHVHTEETAVPVL